MANDNSLRKQKNVCMMFDRFYKLAHNEEHKIMIQNMKHAFLEINPVDAVEEIHGHWETKLDPFKKLYHEFYCSACGGWKHKLAFEHENINYCPNCGAKMDKEA